MDESAGLDRLAGHPNADAVLHNVSSLRQGSKCYLVAQGNGFDNLDGHFSIAVDVHRHCRSRLYVLDRHPNVVSLIVDQERRGAWWSLDAFLGVSGDT